MNNTLNTAYNSDLENNFESNSTSNSKNNLEESFKLAIEMSEKAHDYNALIKMLSSDKIVEKQIAALKLNEIKSKEDAQILVSNLVGQDGKIREAVSFKINELAKNDEFIEFFLDETLYSTYMQGIMDINGNVCRQMVDTVCFLSQNNYFRQYVCNKLPEMINEIFAQIEEIDLSSKQYVISKRNFQLYWCMEALFNFAQNIKFETIKEILVKTGEFYDYTIREKAARIINEIDISQDEKLIVLKESLSNDENYYVRRYLN